MDMPRLITKEVIREVIGLCSTGPVLVVGPIKNEVVMELIGATYDKRAFTINNIRNPVVKYAIMMIGYSM